MPFRKCDKDFLSWEFVAKAAHYLKNYCKIFLFCLYNFLSTFYAHDLAGVSYSLSGQVFLS